MGGGNKKKPISKAQPAEEKAKEKEKGQKGGKKGKEEGKKEEKALSQYDVNQELFNALLSTLRKNKVQTAYDLSAALGVKYGLTLRALKELEKEGRVKILAKNKRSLLYGLP